MRLIHERLPIVPWDGCAFPAARPAQICRGTPHPRVLSHLLSSSAEALDYRDSNEHGEQADTGGVERLAHSVGVVHRRDARSGQCGY